MSKEILCNLCGESCIVNNPHNKINIGLINETVTGGFESTPGNGYGALDDCTQYQFSLCEFCLDYIFSNCVIPIKTSDREPFEPKDNPFIPATQRIFQDKWRRFKGESLNEIVKRNLKRKI